MRRFRDFSIRTKFIAAFIIAAISIITVAFIISYYSIIVGLGKIEDSYLEVEFRPHAHYRVDRHDVYLDLPVTPWEAALGAEIEVPTPTGAVHLTIPPASRAGRKLRLKGRGLPAKTPGDFYFVLQIVLPDAASEAEQEAYRHMGAQFPAFNPRANLGVSK